MTKVGCIYKRNDLGSSRKRTLLERQNFYMHNMNRAMINLKWAMYIFYIKLVSKSTQMDV